MTHEERAKQIKRIFFLVLAVAIIAGVYFYPAPVDKKPATAAKQDDRLVIYHFHLPKDPASEQIADTLNKVQTKYEKYVIVNRVDFQQHPEIAKQQGVTKPPHVVIFAGTQKVFEFQGLWSQVQVERKVEEILRGLKRIDKNWRPPVAGMKPAGG
ncbi:MAG: thioredoxin domain-containing protein [Luteolibacter sp.]|uniref:thioredoxin domain-containing protein n=1 Tax=Luteolibacter sp. TaxID=1962973 RepID=UPI00326786DF